MFQYSQFKSTFTFYQTTFQKHMHRLICKVEQFIEQNNNISYNYNYNFRVCFHTHTLRQKNQE